MRDVIDIDSDLMERMAFDSGREIEIGQSHAVLRTKGKVFRAPLSLPKIPTQRSGDDR